MPIIGVFRSSSQPIRVPWLTPSCLAASFWNRPSSCRRLLRCSPSVWGSSGKAFGRKALKIKGTDNKKATRHCRCGHLEDAALACNRAPRCALDYQSKISGPLFDRIDLHVEVPAVAAADLSLPPPAEGSAEVAARVATARKLQTARYLAARGDAAVSCNAQADGTLLEEIAAPEAEGRSLLTEAAERMKLSARGYHRVLRVARTLADLEGSETVRRLHIAEALSYRRIAPGR